MAPERRPLGVRPQLPVLVGLGALLLVGAGVAARHRETPQSVRLLRKTEPVERTTTTPTTSPSNSSPRVTPPRPAEPPRTSVPAVPAGVDEDVRTLQDWLLSLSRPELRALDGAGELNRKLAQIVAELAKRNSGELDRFLTQLNARMGVVPP